jgi:hypothetical protein
VSETEQTGRPGRYQRSFGGLIGSMIVLVIAVFAIVIIRGTFRETPEYEAPDIDYVEMVTSIQQLGLEPVYPPELPDGWSVKDASFASGSRPSVDLVLTTSDDKTAGVHQADEGERSLLSTYVGDGATENGDTLATDLGTWTGWDDSEDADHAWTTEIGDDTVLVYSSGDAGELRSFVESLTTAELDPAAS